MTEIPIAPSTAVKPSITGSSAATNAPNASSRITSVIGSEVYSAATEVARHGLPDHVVGARHPELFDAEGRVAALHLRNRVERRLHAFVGAVSAAA